MTIRDVKADTVAALKRRRAEYEKHGKDTSHIDAMLAALVGKEKTAVPAAPEKAVDEKPAAAPRRRPRKPAADEPAKD